MKIYSERAYQKWPSWHVVYEWEDVMSKELGCDIVTFGKGICGKIKRKINRTLFDYFKIVKRYTWNPEKEYYLLWVMNAKNYSELPHRNVIPIFLDFPLDVVDTILKVTRDIPCFFVTCYDIYESLCTKGCQNVYYFPQCISDKYYLNEMPAKKIDVVQFGRRNSKLHEYMFRFCEENPNTEYVYKSDDTTLSYVSNISGDLGCILTRDDYIKLVSSSRVSLVSTPSCDDSRPDFGNVDFFTARFYESAALYCRMIGRYTENKESELIGIKEICPNVKCYEEFEGILKHYLNEKQNWDKQRTFIMANLISVRCESIKKTLEEIGVKR